MTSEEMNRTMEFIVQQNAQFAVNMEQFFRSLNDLKEQTARFEAWASEVVFSRDVWIRTKPGSSRSASPEHDPRPPE